MGQGQKIFKWIVIAVGILILLAIVYGLYAVGIIRTGSSGSAPRGADRAGVNPPTSGNVDRSGSFLSRLFSTGDDLPDGFTEDQLSPNFHDVRVQQVSTGRYGFAGARYDRVSLVTNLGSDESLDVTGWRLQSNRDQYLFEQGVRAFQTGRTNTIEPLALAQGDRLELYSSRSPFGVNALYVNRCMGYLNDQVRPVPEFGYSCPFPERAEFSRYTGRCQEYVLSLRSCTAGNPNASQIPATDSACRGYVATLNYNGCVDRRLHDRNFTSGEWRVWLGKQILDPLHDRLLLLDRAGKLVDVYVY